MCFSATASFTAAAVTGAIGTVCVSQVRDRRDLPLAAMPLLFAAQQGLEGLLWLSVHSASGPTAGTGVVIGFLIFALGLWPVYSPAAILLAEPDAKRRRLMLPLLGLGVGLSAYLLFGLVSGPNTVEAVGGHLVYFRHDVHSPWVGLGYVTAVSLPLLLSSHRVVVILGAIVLAGSAIATAFYWEAFLSVWCYFAAAASGVILLHFLRTHPRRLLSARA
jgi:hypothetical protein